MCGLFFLCPYIYARPNFSDASQNFRKLHSWYKNFKRTGRNIYSVSSFFSSLSGEIKIIFVLLQSVRHAHAASAVPTTWWKSDTVRFVFDYLNVGNSSSQSKANAEVTPTDVYMRSRSVPRANSMPSLAHFWVHCIYSMRGYLSVRSF